jgi:cysteine desulfurase
MKELFLDANAHLPLNTIALQAYNDFVCSKANHGHPSSLSEPGRLAATALENARIRIAQLIGAKDSNQIIFTSGCTQACEWAMDIFFNLDAHKYHSDLNPIAISPVEHPAIRDAFEKSDKQYHPSEPSTRLSVDKDGMVQPFQAQSWQDFGIDKIVCTYVQNEIGVIQPVGTLKTALFSNDGREFFSGTTKQKYVLSDMSQALGKIDLNVTNLDVDIAIFGAHKFGGPGNIGFIYLKNTDWWLPFGTGSRYFMDRPGTPDVAGIITTATALEEALRTLSVRQENMKKFQSTLEDGLKMRGYEIIAEQAHRVPNTTFVNIPNLAMLAVMKLGEKGIHVGLGSACGSMHTGPSPLMKVLNREGNINDYLRISQWGEYGHKDAEYFLHVLGGIGL